VCFFSEVKNGNRSNSQRPPTSLGCANYIIECYGIYEFLADIDANREYWRECDPITGEASCIHTCLTWLSEEGFSDFMKQHDIPEALGVSSALEWRQRYMLSHLRRSDG
jgi:hypothetical protein